MEATLLTGGEVLILLVFDLMDAKELEVFCVGDGVVPESKHLNGFEGFDLFGEGGGLELDAHAAVDGDGASLIGAETFDALECGGFASSVCAEEAENFALVNFEGDVF